MPLPRLIFAQLGDFRRIFHFKTVHLDLVWISVVSILMLLWTITAYAKTIATPKFRYYPLSITT